MGVRCCHLLPISAGVYIDKTGDTEIDHDVEVVGWGETKEGLKYWEVRGWHSTRPQPQHNTHCTAPDTGAGCLGGAGVFGLVHARPPAGPQPASLLPLRTHSSCATALLAQVRNSWGTYWGELGFFKVERGVNALQIESGDCW